MIPGRDQSHSNRPFAALYHGSIGHGQVFTPLRTRGANFDAHSDVSRLVQGIHFLLCLRLSIAFQWVQRMEQKGRRFIFFQDDQS